jgi:hypothetical protein
MATPVPVDEIIARSPPDFHALHIAGALYPPLVHNSERIAWTHRPASRPPSALAAAAAPARDCLYRVRLLMATRLAEPHAPQ